ncbi:MAG: DMT family transporter [Candidatus Kerfeldbacteria bacterium]|nr:DMT family transporter [Candidatus Kerfeldbacteria bacterium]
MNTVGFAYALGAAVTWGLVYTVNQKVLSTVSPLVYLFLGSLVTAIITLPILFWQLDSVKQVLSANRTMWWFILAGEVLLVLANFFILSSIKSLGAPLAAVIEISYPLFVALFTMLIFGGSLNLYFWLRAALIFLGSSLIIRFA